MTDRHAIVVLGCELSKVPYVAEPVLCEPVESKLSQSTIKLDSVSDLYGDHALDGLRLVSNTEDVSLRASLFCTGIDESGSWFQWEILVGDPGGISKVAAVETFAGWTRSLDFEDEGRRGYYENKGKHCD